MSFDSLGLSAELCNAVRENGYTKPTPIQAQSIPVILEGRDILAGAQTGTGKTAGFTLPLLQKLSTNLQKSNHRGVRALVLTPTRELAAQVADSVSLYSKFLPLKSTAIFGGVKINPQIQKLRRGVDILVATPGRLLDHANQKTVDLSKVEVLVLDEADRMLDMGFINDIKKIMRMMPKHRQNLLFSATFSNSIKTLANTLLQSPVHIEVNTRNKTADNVVQKVYQVDRKRKRELLSYIIGSQDWKQVLVFTRTKYGADRLSKQLEKDGLGAMAIHGDKSQGARTRALSKFKQGKIQILVATDIAARGLDISQLPHVVNFDLPDSAEDYVHRIGRTGRAGNEGEALSLVCIDELKLLKDVEQLIKRKLTIEVVEGYEPDPSIKAQPVKAKKSRRRPSSGSSAGANNSDRPASRSRNGNRSSNASKNSSKRKKPRKQPLAAATGNDSEQSQKTSYKKKRRKPSRQVPALLGG